MKKHSVILMVLALSIATYGRAQDPAVEKKADPTKNFSLVNEVQPVPEAARIGFESITSKDAVIHLKFLASDLLQGRETASDGYDIAALYFATMFELLGLEPAGDSPRTAPRGDIISPRGMTRPRRSYFQNIAFKEILKTDSRARVDWQKGATMNSLSFYPGQDYTYSGTETRSFSAPVVFVGYGIREESLKFDEYRGLDVKGKIVMMLTETPGKGDPDSPFFQARLQQKYYPVTRTRRTPSPKAQLAEELGAMAILMVENSPESNRSIAQQDLAQKRIDDERPIFPGSRRRLLLIQEKSPRMPWETIPTINISREAANKILDSTGKDIAGLKSTIEETLQPQSMTLTGVSFSIDIAVETQLVHSTNVLAYIEGSHPQLKDEAIVIGGHLDHLGQRGEYIFNGADDNGSGSAGVLEVAEAFVKSPVKPKRSILFALWTGEEKGLFGSRYYVENPFFPLVQTVANLNLDMICRSWKEEDLRPRAAAFGLRLDEDFMKKIDLKKFVSLAFDAATPRLGEYMTKNNQYVGLDLHLRPSAEATGGSDHMPFGQNQVPWVAFHTALHEDYHQPSDTVEKIEPQHFERMLRLVYLTALDLAENGKHPE